MNNKMCKNINLIVLILTIVCVKYSVSGAEPSYLEAQVGSYAVFNCPLDYPDDIPIPFLINWNKGNKNVFSWYDGELTASNSYIGRVGLVDIPGGEGSVNLTSIRESDGGWYECKVIFPNRTPSTRHNGTWFYLTIDGGALMKIPPINKTVLEGEQAFLQCVMKYPDLSFATWLKDGEPIINLNGLNLRSHMGPDGSLTITSTVMSDLGEYECIVQDIEGQKQSARAFLNIQYKAKIVYTPPEVHFTNGQPAILNCHFRSNPPLTNLRWEKDGFLFDPFNVQGVFYEKNGSLFFNKADESHAGLYSCTPYNELGTEGSSPLINVIVQKPPVFTIKPKSLYIHKLGETVVMVCDAKDRDGTHRPNIVWTRKDGLPLPYERVTNDNGNLTIVGIQDVDRGMYQCSTSNEAATINIDTELMIANVPPHPPYNLTASSTDTSIMLKWQPGYRRPMMQYVVWYRLSDGTEWRTLNLEHESESEANITNLLSGREYEFMVLSQDRYGDGMFSKSFRYWTKQNDFNNTINEKGSIEAFSQIGPPENMTVEITSNGFLVKWEPPAYGNDLLRLYIVRWYKEPMKLDGSAETRETSYLIPYLDEDEIYIFKVFSLSISDYEISGNEVELLVPPYRRMKAIAIGTTAGLLFLLAGIGIFIYMKRNWFLKHKQDEVEKIRS